MNLKDDKVVNPTEKLILQAAEKEFLVKGFSGARTTAIAEAAGVTHAMLHYYFRTKEKLFVRIITEKIELLKHAFVAPLAEWNLPLDELIYKMVERHLEFIAENPDLPRFIIGEIYSNPERLSAFLDRLSMAASIAVPQLQQKIDKAAAQGQCRHVDARMLMLDIVSLNVFPVMASPAINAVFHDMQPTGREFLELRKKENYDTIIRKLRP